MGEIFPSLRECGDRPFSGRCPVLPTIAKRRCIGFEQRNDSLPFLADGLSFLARIYPDHFSLCEFILILPTPPLAVRADNDVQHLVHGVKPNPRPTKRLL